MCETGFPKIILHGMTVFVLWHDNFGTAVEKSFDDATRLKKHEQTQVMPSTVTRH